MGNIIASKRMIAGGLAVLIAGCATNGFEKFYSPMPGSESVRNNPRFERPNGDPKVFTYSEDPKSDLLGVEESGYVEIGQSSFYGPPAIMTHAKLSDQANKVGAELVLVHSQYKDTISGAVPWTVANPPQVSTVNTSGTVNAYGTGGYATGSYSGQSVITSPGGTTTYSIPYSVSRNDVIATFWVHQDLAKVRLGVLTAPLPEASRSKLQRNTGVLAAGIMRGTPAFVANILRGDVIVKIAGEDVIDPPDFVQQLTKFEGQTVEVEVLRGDTSKTITVTLHRSH